MKKELRLKDLWEKPGGMLHLFSKYTVTIATVEKCSPGFPFHVPMTASSPLCSLGASNNLNFLLCCWRYSCASGNQFSWPHESVAYTGVRVERESQVPDLACGGCKGFLGSY